MRRIITYPNVASTLALVVALSGGAYAAGLVGTSDLKDGAVTTAKIHKRAVTVGKIGSKAVHAGKLSDNSVGGRQLIDGSVGAQELSTDLGSLLTTLTSNQPIASESANDTIQQVGPAPVAVATLTFPKAGSYLVTGTLRMFPRASNPGHNINCSLTGEGLWVNNEYVADNGGVDYVPFTGLTTAATDGETTQVTCQQLGGNGEITLTYRLDAVRVATP